MGQVIGTSSVAGEPAVSGSNSVKPNGIAGQFNGLVEVSGNLFLEGTATATQAAIAALNASGGAAIEGLSSNSQGPGVYGGNSAAWPCIGVNGSCNNGHGVKGSNGAGSSITMAPAGCGVWGDSNNGIGVFGTSNGRYGVYGESTNSGGFGVCGVNNSAWPCIAVYGDSGQGHGVKGVNGAGSGTTPDAGCGVWGDSATGIGVYGASKGGSGTTPNWPCGVWGDSKQGFGVFGASASSDGVHGLTTSSGAASGVYGESKISTGVGVAGVNNANGHAVKGTSATGSGLTPGAPCGVWGDSTTGWGVCGLSQSSDGVHGETSSQGVSGVAGINLNGGNGVFGWSTGNAGYFDGNVTVTGNHQCNGTITALVDVKVGGEDCAELFDLKLLEIAEPGTVMVIDGDGALRASEMAYDRAVAGVVSGAGEFKPGIVLGQRASDTARAKIALVGKVYCKVDADCGPIAVGDLLTTSDIPGHAMKATDPLKGFGAVIGKALRPMASGRGLLPILVALQ